MRSIRARTAITGIQPILRTFSECLARPPLVYEILLPPTFRFDPSSPPSSPFVNDGF